MTTTMRLFGLALASLVLLTPKSALAMDEQTATQIVVDASVLLSQAETALREKDVAAAEQKLASVREDLLGLRAALEGVDGSWKAQIQRSIELTLGRAFCLSGKPTTGLSHFDEFKRLSPNSEQLERAEAWEAECRALLPPPLPDVPLVSPRVLQLRRRAALVTYTGALAASAVGTGLSFIKIRPMFVNQFVGTMAGATGILVGAVLLPATLVALSRQGAGLADGRRFDGALMAASGLFVALGAAQAGLAFSQGDETVLWPALIGGSISAGFGLVGLVSGANLVRQRSGVRTGRPIGAGWTFGPPASPPIVLTAAPGLAPIPALRR